DIGDVGDAVPPGLLAVDANLTLEGPAPVLVLDAMDGAGGRLDAAEEVGPLHGQLRILALVGDDEGADDRGLEGVVHRVAGPVRSFQRRNGGVGVPWTALAGGEGHELAEPAGRHGADDGDAIAAVAE